MLISFLRSRPPFHRAGNDDQLPLFAFRRRPQPERTLLRLRKVRLELGMRLRRRRRTHQRRKLLLLLSEIKRSFLRGPIQICRPERRRPFQLKIPMKSRLNVQRLFRFHVENNESALFPHGNATSSAPPPTVPCTSNPPRPLPPSTSPPHPPAP